MYTSCPECGTVFRISTADLRVAEGHVRCGHCSATFNALGSLSDQPPPAEGLAPAIGTDEPAAAAGSGDTLEFDIPEGNWSNFFEGDARPSGPPHVAAEAGPETEQEAQSEADAEAEAEPVPQPAATPDEHAAEPAEAEPDIGTDNDADTSPDRGPAIGDDIGISIGSETVDQGGLYRALAAEPGGLNLDDDADWQALLDEMPEDDESSDPVYVIEPDAAAEPEAEPAELDAPVASAADLSPDHSDDASYDLSDDLSEDELSPDLPADTPWDVPVDLVATRAPAPLPDDFAVALSPVESGDVPPPAAIAPTAERPFVWTPPSPAAPVSSGRSGFFMTGSALLALFLVMQLLHQRRDVLATNPALTEPLQRVYTALGVPLWPAWDLRAYEVRNYEAVADRSSQGALDILARIAIVGNDQVGLPLVRVTLRDRFGKPIGTRVFEPVEYLGKTPRPREPVSPGTLIPVEISLKDPGSDAQGFDVDVCLMSQHEGITCQAEREPFAR